MGLYLVILALGVITMAILVYEYEEKEIEKNEKQDLNATECPEEIETDEKGNVIDRFKEKYVSTDGNPLIQNDKEQKDVSTK